MNELLLFALCAPSGAGKTTLSKCLIESFPGLRFSVSHTTRGQRRGEEDGVDYHFVGRSAFEQHVAAGLFAEWAEVHGNLYGTSLAELDRARADSKQGLIFDIDHQGARQLRAKLPRAVSIFVLPPSMDELRRRLVARATDSTDVIERRLGAAREEISHYGFFDYLVVNDDLETAKRELLSIIEAEQARRWRRASVAEAILRSPA